MTNGNLKCAKLNFSPFLNPLEHRIVPNKGVLWLEAKVVLGGKYEQLRRHALPLQCLKCCDPFSLHNPVVFGAMYH